MSHAPQNPVDTDVPLNNFSHCHAGILRHLDTFGELPALLAPAQRARAVAEDIVKFFRAAAFEHHEEEEQDLFTAVLADARPGEERERVQAMIALGDDCAASGGEMAETLQYYRRAQSAAREVPDIAYTPQVCLRLAQYETQYLSRKKALLQVAEAVQGFRILQAEGETDAAAWLREAELLTDQLLADDKNA